jgi:hypothetical protein
VLYEEAKAAVWGKFLPLFFRQELDEFMNTYQELRDRMDQVESMIGM